MSYEGHLRIIIKERLYLITQLTSPNGIVVKVVEPLVEQFEQCCTPTDCSTTNNC